MAEDYTYEDRCILDQLRIEDFQLPSDYRFYTNHCEPIEAFETAQIIPNTDEDDDDE